jgi:hydrogenase maturation protease
MDTVLVAGIGNVLMGDDAIGPYCVRHLRARFQFPPNVEVVDLGAPGLDLSLHVAAAEVVIFVDSLRSVPPGEVRTFSQEEILSAGYDPRLDTHAPALEEAIAIAGLSGHAPRQVRLVGLGGDSFDLGRPLSEAARRGMGALENALLAELAGIGIAVLQRAEPSNADIWWEHQPAREMIPTWVRISVQSE